MALSAMPVQGACFPIDNFVKLFDFATRDFPLAIIEAKASYKSAADELQQAKNYAEMLGLKFAYATNGHEIIEFD